MNLYEINTEIEKAIEAIFLNADEETGEIRKEDVDNLEALNVARDEKLESIGCYIKNKKAMAEAIKEEEKALKERRETLESKVENMKAYVANALQGEKWASAKVAFSFRKSKAVVIDESYIENIPKEYLIEQDPKIDKKAIKADIEMGKDLEGIAHIEEKQNLQIK